MAEWDDTCCSVDADGAEWHFTVEKHVAKQLQAALAAAEQRAATAPPSRDRWKRAAKHEQQRRKSAEKLWLKAVLKHVQTDLELRKTRVAVTLMGKINDSEARDWDAIIEERATLEAERDTLRARLDQAEAVIEWYARDEAWESFWDEPRDDFWTEADLDGGDRAKAYLTAHPPRAAAGSGAIGDADPDPAP